MSRAFRATTQWARVHPVAAFYLLAFAISWLGFLPAVAGSWGVPLFGSRLWMLALILPAGGPAIAAAITVRLIGLRGRLWASIRGRVTARWYLLAVLLPVLLVAAAVAVSRFLWPHESPAAPPVPLKALAPFAFMSLLANPWEEIGWRGFAFEALERKLNPLLAALIVGVLWGLWHIPLFLSGTTTATLPFFPPGFPFVPWFVAILAQSIIVGWLYNRSGHSIGVAIVYHVAFNLAAAAIGVHTLASDALVKVAAALLLLGIYGTQLAAAPALSPEVNATIHP